MAEESMIDKMAGDQQIASIAFGEVLMIAVCLPSALLLGLLCIATWVVVEIGSLTWRGLFGEQH